MGMRNATRIASGTKPSQLSNTVPGMDEENSTQAGTEAELRQLAKNAAQAPQQPAGASGVDPETENLLAAFGDSGGQQAADPNAPGQDQFIQPDARQQPNLDTNSLLTSIPNTIENAVPAAVSAVGTVGGAAIGAGAGGMGVGAGAEAGNAAAAAVNVALAPYYKKIADSMREALGIPVAQIPDFEQRVKMAFQETLGIAIPRFLAQSNFVTDKVGANLAKTMAPQVAENLKTMQGARDAGIDLGPRGLFKGTQYESGVENGLASTMQGNFGRDAHDAMFMAQRQNLDNVTNAFQKLKNAVGSTMEKDGTSIIKPENVEIRKDMIGKQIGELNRLAIEHAGEARFDPAPLLGEFRDALELHGIKTNEGMVPPEVVNKLDPDARAVANQYNKMVSDISRVHMENGASLSAEELKYYRKRGNATPSFEGGSVQKGEPMASPDTVQAGLPQDQHQFPMFHDVTSEELRPSNPPGAPVSGITNETRFQNPPAQEVQGSLGLVEQSDYLNKPVTVDAKGNPVTRAQFVAQTSKLPIYSAEGITNKGVSLSDLHALTDKFQRLAEFDSFNRQIKQKQFGSLSHVARDMRDQITRQVLDDGAKEAASRGDAIGAKELGLSATRLENLNKLYGQHADAQDLFFKAVNDDPAKATENLMRQLGQREYENMLKVITPRERGALSSAYVDNLIKESSDEGVLIDPNKIMKTLAKDGDRAKSLLGDETYDSLKKLTNYAKIAEKIDSNVGGTNVPNDLIRGVVKLLGNKSGPVKNYFEQVFSRAPRIKSLVKDTPAYRAAFEKYSTPMSRMDRVSSSKDTVGTIVGANSLVPAAKELQSTYEDNKRMKSKADEIKALDLQFEGN